MEVVGEPRLPTTGEDEAEVFKLAIPEPQFFTIAGLMFGRSPDPKHMPRCHVEEGGDNHRNIESKPSSKQRRAEVLPQLGIVASLDQGHWLCRQHISRDHEEDGDGVVATREEVSDAGHRCEVVFPMVAPGVL